MAEVPACLHSERRISSSRMHSQKIGCQIHQKIIFGQCLATAGFDKQQHFDGKSDGDFPRENRLSFADQLDEKLVPNRVGVIGQRARRLSVARRLRHPAAAGLQPVEPLRRHLRHVSGIR
jgi:hypothetical protein